MRDQFLMIFLYDTGARIQEVLDVKICDIKVDRTPTVTRTVTAGLYNKLLVLSAKLLPVSIINPIAQWMVRTK